MQKTALILACSSLMAVLPAQDRRTQDGRTVAADANRYASMAAGSFNKLKVPGEEVARNVKRLTTELHWHKSLSAALAAGREKGKPIVWIQALGDITGFL